MDDNHHKKMLKDFRKRFFVSLIITIPILLLSPLIQEFFNFQFSFTGKDYLLFLLSSIVFFYGGIPFLKGSYKELKSKSPGMMTLVAFAIIVSYFYSSAVVFGLSGKFFFWELSTLIVVMLLGHWIEMRSVIGAGKALESLTKLLPSKAHLVKDDGIVDVELSELKKGNVVLVKPGEKIPVDGVIKKGKSSVNESLVTGESKPVVKEEGDEVIGGSINGEGVLRVKITKLGEESYVNQVIKMVEKARESKSKTQSFADSAAKWLTIIAISIGGLTLGVWIYFGESFVFALERMVTVVVTTCPHALGLAIPLVVAVSTSISAKNGLLVRDRTAFEKARKIEKIVFDKTGTLTKGEFGVSEVIGGDKVLKYAVSLESNSEHPIAQGIVRKGEEKGIKLLEVKDFRNIPGRGVEGMINNKIVRAVGNNYLKENDIKIDNNEINRLGEKGRTIVYVLEKKKIIGAVDLSDIIRDESKEAVKELKNMGISCVMITGDNEKVAEWVGSELGLDDYYSEVLPDDKAEMVKKIQSGGVVTAMVGDGVNDAPALVQSDVGIAIGAGTDVAVESADIILVKNNPEDVVSIIKLSRATYDKMVQNLLWATGYNIVAVPLAAGVLYNMGFLLSPAMGAVLMSLSTVIVAVNARFLSV